MNFIGKFLAIVAVFLLIIFKVSAQHESTLHMMNGIPQAVQTNPALVPKYNVSIGLPGLSSTYVGVANTGFAYADLFPVSEEYPDSMNYKNLYNIIKKKNKTNISVATDLFSLGFKAGTKMHFTFNVTEKVLTRLILPREAFIVLLDDFESELKGKTTVFDPKLDVMHYREYALGTSYAINEKFTIGGRFKMLYGKANLNTGKSEYTISASQDAQEIRLSADALYNTSGVDNLINNREDMDAQKYLMNKNNKGYAFDLGVTYKVLDRLTLGASILDIGRIKWTDNVKNYSLNKNNTISFNPDEYENDEDAEEADTSAFDFDFVETSNSYSTSLPGKAYLSANYYLGANFNAGVILFGEVSQKTLSPSFSASLGKDFGRTLSFNLSYTAANGSANQFGAGFALKLFPIQLYVVSDNIVGTALSYKKAKDFSCRFGMNLVFGRKKTEDKQSYK